MRKDSKGGGANLPAKIESSFPVLSGDKDEIMLSIRENLGDDITPDMLIKIPIPGGGGTTWEFEDAVDGLVSTKVLEGVLLAVHFPRARWDKPMEESDGEPPVCNSYDGKIGIGDPGGPCKLCVYDQYGTSLRGGNGKACVERRDLYILREGQFLPNKVSVPPTSIKGIMRAQSVLASRGISPFSVITSLSLRAEVSGGQKYSMVVMDYCRDANGTIIRFDSETTGKFRAMGEMFGSRTFAQKSTNDLVGDTMGEKDSIKEDAQ